MKEIPIMKSLIDAKAESGLSYSTLRRLCLEGKIVHIRVG